jgi:hypothetical protein
VVLCESCQVCLNKIVELFGQREGIVVGVMWVHGVKRGGGRSVREEDRHHRQVLVTVELSSFSVRTQPSAVTRTRK